MQCREGGERNKVSGSLTANTLHKETIVDVGCGESKSDAAANVPVGPYSDERPMSFGEHVIVGYVRGYVRACSATHVACCG